MAHSPPTEKSPAEDNNPAESIACNTTAARMKSLNPDAEGNAPPPDGSGAFVRTGCTKSMQPSEKPLSLKAEQKCPDARHPKFEE
jgi:hypothetical protein